MIDFKEFAPMIVESDMSKFCRPGLLETQGKVDVAVRVQRQLIVRILSSLGETSLFVKALNDRMNPN